ncbi:MAG: HPr family phosphocarrier protein [Thermodesulfobacteriota bacterium]
MNEIQGLEKKLTIKNKLGMHARAAALFVQTANQFESDITIGKDAQEVNAKSIMGILILAAACGSEVIVKAKGADALEALDAIENLIERRFDEEE